MCSSTTFLLPALEDKPSGLHLTIKLQDKYGDIKCFPLPLSSGMCSKSGCAALPALGQTVARFLFAAFNYISYPSRYDRIEIPIHVVPHETIGKVCLESAVELPKILCQEEQDAYRRIHR